MSNQEPCYWCEDCYEAYPEGCVKPINELGTVGGRLICDDCYDSNYREQERFKFVPEHEQHIATLEARLAECEKDAERLELLIQDRRFIDKHIITGRYCVSHAVSGVNNQHFFDSPREAIDAAINQPGLKPGDSTDGVEG